jgi:hypothetical protein
MLQKGMMVEYTAVDLLDKSTNMSGTAFPLNATNNIETTFRYCSNVL